MLITRRSIVLGSLATATAASSGLFWPSLASASASGELIAVMQSDPRSFDPVHTSAYITNSLAAMFYDTLFGLDEQGRPQPQMVSDYEVSEDRLSYRFILRDGLAFSDGSLVTSSDVVASMSRWAKRDIAGQLMFKYVSDTPIFDDKSFGLVLTEPFGLVLETLGKIGGALYIMREKDALTDPFEQVTEHIGSGPFTFNLAASTIGVEYIFDRNPNYIPRSEPASGTAGGKVVKIDRVVWKVISDAQTAISALQNGEIDFYEMPPLDLLPVLEADGNLKLDILNKGGNVGFVRLNWLHAPFDNVKARQAMLHLIRQSDVLRASFGDDRYWQECASIFGCGTDMENDANTGWFTEGQNIEKAAALFKEAGYDGRPVILLQPTDIPIISNTIQLLAQWLRQAGVDAQLAPSDWGGVVARRSVTAPPEEGGWNIFMTWNGASTLASPILNPGHQTNGLDGYVGWPTDALNEELRVQWTMAPDLDSRRDVARCMQENAWNIVPQLLVGQWTAPVAYRSNLSGFLICPDLLIPFWNVSRS